MKFKIKYTKFLKRRFPIYRQLESNDCGPTCIRMVCSFYGKEYSLSTIKKACNITRLGSTVQDILSGARNLGFTCSAVKISLIEIQRMPLPSIIYWKQEHFVVLYDIKVKKK